jgi:hypothetical protein
VRKRLEPGLAQPLELLAALGQEVAGGAIVIHVARA